MLISDGYAVRASATIGGIPNLWHEHCYVRINWDFSAQLKQSAAGGTGNFEPGSALSTFRQREPASREAADA